jgi:hypothetical protein
MTVPTPSKADVDQWTPAQRAELARILDQYVSRPVPASRMHRRRAVVIAVTVAGSALLLPWIAYLSVTLPRSHSVRTWNVAWIGFDVALASALATSGWLVGKRRQLAMLGLIVAATLLVCDAWFDVCLSWNTSDQGWSLAAAGLVELPSAALLATSAVLVLRRSSVIVQQLRGRGDAPVRIWRQPFLMVPPEQS